MLWTYRHGGFTGQSEQVRWLIYYWQGAHASRQDKVYIHNTPPPSTSPPASLLNARWPWRLGSGGDEDEGHRGHCKAEGR
jgi:hypothetical protein